MVDIFAVPDLDNHNNQLLMLNAIDNSVVAAANTKQALVLFSLQRNRAGRGRVIRQLQDMALNLSPWL